MVIGGVHPNFMPQEALKACDAVVVGEVELVITTSCSPTISNKGRCVAHINQDTLHPMTGMPMPRCQSLEENRYVNCTFVQTSRGCHQRLHVLRRAADERPEISLPARR